MRPRTIEVSRSSISDGKSTIPITITQSGDQPEAHIIMANGWCSGQRQACRPVAGWLRAASRPFAVVTYDDPHLGETAYAQSYRTERFMRVVQAFSARDTAVALGHSRGWLSIAEAHDELTIRGLRAALALTPVGIGPLMARRAVMVSSLHETLNAGATLRTRQGLLTFTAIARAALPHCRTNPAQAVQEIKDIFDADVRIPTATFSQAVPTTIVSASNDALFPVDVHSLYAYGYQGVFATVPATHLGAIADPAAAPAVGTALDALWQRSVDRFARAS